MRLIILFEETLLNVLETNYNLKFDANNLRKEIVFLEREFGILALK